MREEVGAIGAALCSEHDAKGPLALTPVKACFGHTEGAAGVYRVNAQAVSTSLHLCSAAHVADEPQLPSGMSGIQMAVLSLSAHAPSQLLRAVNPYLSAALGEWLRHAVLPRQRARGWSTADSAGMHNLGLQCTSCVALETFHGFIAGKQKECGTLMSYAALTL